MIGRNFSRVICASRLNVYQRTVHSRGVRTSSYTSPK